jgi:TusA-related sulfurtransferase
MTTHHFKLLPDGGSIEVEADDPHDHSSREAVQQHLQHIAKVFSAGDFDLPMFIHATHPPGVAAMKRLRKKIEYKETATPKGAQVRITTADPQAVTAIHDFLRFQIKDHNTGDPMTLQD